MWYRHAIARFWGGRKNYYGLGLRCTSPAHAESTDFDGSILIAASILMDA
jgi:hypothetical protein